MTGRVCVIAGASGLVGARCLEHLLAHPEVSRVTALVRRPLDVEHPKLTQQVVDFAQDLVDKMPKDTDDAYCALGTTMKQAGSQEAFLAVDKGAVLSFAKAARARGARRFVLVSSLGADARSMNFYMRTKGEVERDVGALGYDVVHVLRPSMLDGPRKEERRGERWATAIARVFGPVLGGYAPIQADVVGRAMVKLAFTGPRGFMVHDSKAVQRIGA